jgi:phage shock protein A
MMARQPNPDLTNTLTMLHTAVVHTDKNIRDALDKSVEKLESAGRAAHEKTTKEVVDELGRMRSNFRDVYNKLNSNGESLSSTVHDVVAQLRAELREVRVVLADLSAPAPPPLTTPPSPASAEQEASGAKGDHRGPAAAPVTTLTESDAHPADSALQSAIPAQRSAEQEPDSSPSSELPVAVVRQAVRDVLSEELAPVLTALTTQVSTDDGPAGDHQDASDLVREAVGKIKQEVGTALAEARSALASLRQEIADLHAAVEELRPQPDTAAETAVAEVSPEHSTLLKTAARVSSASLLCHRDIWEFITAHAGRHPHFRVPPQVADEGDERIRAALSGRSLIALLISLHSIKHTACDGDGDQELAATLYERIEESLTDLTPSGQPVTITLDDRTAPGVPAAASRNEADSERENPGTPPASTEQDTAPGEEAGPAAA